MKEKPILTADLLRLQPFSLDDVPRVAQRANDKRVSEMLTHMPHPYTQQAAKDWIATHEGEWQAAKAAHFAIWHNEPSVFMGSISIEDIKGGTGVLGYWLGVDFWGKGYATMAGELIIEFGFRAADRGGLGLQRITACHYGPNTASGQVLQKLGFVHLRSDASPHDPIPKHQGKAEYAVVEFYELKIIDYKGRTE